MKRISQNCTHFPPKGNEKGEFLLGPELELSSHFRLLISLLVSRVALEILDRILDRPGSSLSLSLSLSLEKERERA